MSPLRKVLSVLLALLPAPAAAQNTFFAASPGQMIYRDAPGWAAVSAPLFAGQILMSNGPTAMPIWTFDLSNVTQLIYPRIATNNVLGNVTGGTASPIPITQTQFLDTLGFDIVRPPAIGAIPYKDKTTSNWQTLQPGPASWVLVSGGAGENPFWSFSANVATPGVIGGCLVSQGVGVSPIYTSCLNANNFAVTSPVTWVLDGATLKSTISLSSVGLSVIGNAGTATGADTAITGTANQFLGINSSGTTLGFQTMTGDVTLSGATATITNNAVSNAKFRQGAARSVVGVTGNATANVADIQGTASQFLGVNAANTSLTFQTMTGDVTLSGPTSTITNNAVTVAKMAAIAANTVISNWTSGSATPVANTIPSCAADGSHALTYTNGTGLLCTSMTGLNSVVTVKKQVFTSNGTYTPSAGMIFAMIECLGPGGGGGGVAGVGSQFIVAGGGGAGGYSRVLVTAATIGASKAVVVGTGGAGGAAGDSGGSNGSAATTVGATICVANPGLGGGSGSNRAGGAAGAAGTGDLASAGGGGQGGFINTVGTTIGTYAGGGGNSHFGGGAIPTTTGTGVAAGAYGGGGSGALAASAVNNAGGNGFAGVVYITEYNTQ